MKAIKKPLQRTSRRRRVIREAPAVRLVEVPRVAVHLVEVVPVVALPAADPNRVKHTLADKIKRTARLTPAVRFCVIGGVLRVVAK